MTRTALLIMQKPTSNPGRLGSLLQSDGYALDVRCPNAGSALPLSAEEFDAVVVFGGPMSANDGATMPGIRAQLDFLPKALDSGKPVLGICLGAQLLARVLGADVSFHPDGLVEIGYHPIVPTPQGQQFFNGPMTVYQWHRQGFALPRGATCLATGETFANQAFRYADNVYGIQFHPEAGRETVERWTSAAAQDLNLPGAQPRERQLADFERHDASILNWLKTFVGQVFQRTSVREFDDR